MEEALKYELQNNILELANNIYPTNAPETSTKPYLVYARISTERLKTLDGYTDNQNLSYMFNIMTPKYKEMAVIRNKVEQLLLSLPERNIGSDGSIHVKDISINNIDETYEHEIKVNRGIIDFTIYF